MKNLQIINYRIRGGDNYFKEINSSIKWLTIFIIGLISLKSVCCNSKLDNFKKSKEIELLKLNKSIINYDSINFNNKVNTSDTFNYDNFIEWIGFADSNINSQISEVKLNELLEEAKIKSNIINEYLNLQEQLILEKLESIESSVNNIVVDDEKIERLSDEFTNEIKKYNKSSDLIKKSLDSQIKKIMTFNESVIIEKNNLELNLHNYDKKSNEDLEFHKKAMFKKKDLIEANEEDNFLNEISTNIINYNNVKDTETEIEKQYKILNDDDIEKK